MSEREQFEAWAKTNPTLINAEFWTAKSIAKNAWEAAWRAARAQPAPITSESGNQAAQGASAITSEPAQAGALLSQECVRELWDSECHKYDLTRDIVQGFALAIESLVRSKLGAGVPMTDAQMRAAFAMAHPQDHADMQDGSPANAVERIGARNVYRRFERGIRAAERHHGIVGKEGGNV